MTTRPLLAILLPLALAMPAAADCCDGWCREMLRAGTPETPAGQYYVIKDFECQPDCEPVFPSIWIYEESNGIQGLQRGDVTSDETCGGRFAPDTVIL